MDRRNFLQFVGSSVVAVESALAGCNAFSDNTTSEPSPTTSTETTVHRTTGAETRSPTKTEERTPASLIYHTEVRESAVAGQRVQILVTVKNTGGMDASRSLELKLDGAIVDTKTIDIEPQSEKRLQFDFITYRLGSAELAIDDTQIGSLSVIPSGTPVTERAIDRKLGANHVGSKYRFQDGDLLNEGAEVLQNLGSRVIKTWLNRPDLDYPFTSWPEFNSMVEIASHPHYQELFDRPFDTHVLQANAYTEARASGGGGYFVHEISQKAEREEEKSFYDLTKYLLEEYDGTGKEFLLQNWEGDWILAGGAGEKEPPDPAVLERGKRWWNARQRGIERARQDVESDAAVFGVCEINRVRQAMEEGERWIVNSILEDLEVDLVSYSSWDLCKYIKNQPELTDDVRREVRNTLEFINERAPDRTDYLKAALGPEANSVFIGEFGAPLREDGPERAMRAISGIVEESLDWGTPYVLFWQTYDNEVYIDGKKVVVEPNIESMLDSSFGGKPGVDDVRGFYLIRPDGRRSPVWFYYANHLGTHQDEFVRIELQYDSVRLESDVNPEVSTEHARKLAIGCQQIEIGVNDRTAAFDIGSPEDEVVFVEGMYSPEETDQFTFRWFGGARKRTVFYVPYSRHGITGSPSLIRFDAWGVEGGVEADVLVEGAKVGHIAFDDRRETHILEIDG